MIVSTPSQFPLVLVGGKESIDAQSEARIPSSRYSSIPEIMSHVLSICPSTRPSTAAYPPTQDVCHYNKAGIRAYGLVLSQQTRRSIMIDRKAKDIASSSSRAHKQQQI
jgi:hypothetical protein